jgi:Protein of unknown function (DUF2846)
MTFPQNRVRALVPIYLTLLTACAATVPMSDSGSDAAAKQFHADSAKASIYIVRGAGINPEHLITTQIDGITVGSLAQNTYLLVTVAPGQHTLSVIGPTNQEDLPANVAAGQIYFFQTSMIWAGPGERHRHIEAMSDADGRQYVSGESRAVGINP